MLTIDLKFFQQKLLEEVEMRFVVWDRAGRIGLRVAAKLVKRAPDAVVVMVDKNFEEAERQPKSGGKFTAQVNADS